jgi:hypothetical protein
MNTILTTTLRDLNESSQVFYSEEWKLNGSKIVAIHGRDKSTEKKYQNLPKGFVLVSVIEKKPGYSTGTQKQIGVSLGETVAA